MNLTYALACHLQAEAVNYFPFVVGNDCEILNGSLFEAYQLTNKPIVPSSLILVYLSYWTAMEAA